MISQLDTSQDDQVKLAKSRASPKLKLIMAGGCRYCAEPALKQFVASTKWNSRRATIVSPRFTIHDSRLAHRPHTKAHLAKFPISSGFSDFKFRISDIGTTNDQQISLEPVTSQLDESVGGFTSVICSSFPLPITSLLCSCPTDEADNLSAALIVVLLASSPSVDVIPFRYAPPLSLYPNSHRQHGCKRRCQIQRPE